MKSIISFIEDDDKFVDAIDASEEELITATSYIQLIFYHIRQYIGDEYKIPDLHGNSINAIIKEDLDNLTFKEKILILFMLLGAAPVTETITKVIYNIENKIDYKMFYDLIVYKGLMQLNVILIELFKEIISIRDNIEMMIEKIEGG